MAIPKNNIRGLQDIRTHTGKVDKVHETYRAYQRIGVLEMERVRKTKERESAAFRAKIIDDRFDEIDTEKEKILTDLGLEQKDEEKSLEELEPEPEPMKEGKKEGFTIKY